MSYNLRKQNHIPKYGSINEIRKAFDIGAGILYRDDVELLLNRIKELEDKERANNVIA